MVTLWIAGSGEAFDKRFSPAPVIAWQSAWAGVQGQPATTTYNRSGGCTLERAYLLHLIASLADMPEGSRVALIADYNNIVDAFRLGRLAGWASKGFRKRPAANREEWRQLWEVLKARRLTLEAVRPKKGSPDAGRLLELSGLAARKRRGISEPSMDDLALNENPWAKPEDPDALRHRAADKDPW
ncbi:hypothetical protein BA190_27465 [Labrys sp. WJW]|nr:hypothetical protein BA190_27465 [Labrys sp. WJW]